MPTSLHFARSSLTVDLWAEALSLLVEHWREIGGHVTGAKLNPDLEQYARMQEAGIIRVFVARDERENLQGYALFTVTQSVHCQGITEAQQDALVVRPDYRGGFGSAFTKFVHASLFAEGVDAIYEFTPASRDFGAVLERQGFERMGTLYAKTRPAFASVAA